MEGREKRAERVALAAIRGLVGPGAELIVAPSPGAHAQADLVLRVAGRDYPVQVKWAGQGYPQDVRRVLKESSWAEGDVLHLLCSTQFSPGAIELMRDHGISYADEAGQVRVTDAGLALVRELALPRPPPRQLKWSAGAATTAELVLATRDDVLPPIVDLAAQLPLSPATVGKALRFFDAEGWTRHTGSARGVGAEREVIDRPAMLGSWARWRATRTTRRAFLAQVPWRDPWSVLADRVAPHLAGEMWGLTGWAAAELMAPYATTFPRLQVYVSDDAWPDVTTRMGHGGLRPVADGARVVVWSMHPDLLRLGSHGTWPLVSTPRIYADLVAEGGRAEGAAEHLREAVLGY